MINPPESRYARIFIFTDFSGAALNAAYYAAAFAQQVHAKHLLICYSDYAASMINTQNLVLIEQLYSRNIAKLNTLSDELRILVKQSITINPFIDHRPLDVIVNNLKKEHSVGLIVIGLAGKSASDQSLIGSNTMRITQIASLPILIIPESASFKSIKNVVFACNLKKISEKTPIFVIKHLVDKLKAKVSILSVSQREDSFDPNTMDEPRFLRQFWGRQEHNYHYTNNEDVVMEIMNFASKNQVQLVIAVPRKYGFFEKLFHNSVTQKLTLHIHLPLLLFKEDE